MSTRVEPTSLSRDELVDALVFTRANEDASRRVRVYYQLLPTDVLLSLAATDCRVPDL